MPADKTISSLTTASALTGAELIPVVQSGETRQVAVSLLALAGEAALTSIANGAIQRSGDAMTSTLGIKSSQTVPGLQDALCSASPYKTGVFFDWANGRAGFYNNGVKVLDIQNGADGDGTPASKLRIRNNTLSTTRELSVIGEADDGTAVNLMLSAGSTGHVGVEAPLKLRSRTVAQLAALSAATYVGCIIYVSDGTANKRLAVSDGTDWRWPDGAVVS